MFSSISWDNSRSQQPEVSTFFQALRFFARQSLTKKAFPHQHKSRHLLLYDVRWCHSGEGLGWAMASIANAPTSLNRGWAGWHHGSLSKVIFYPGSNVKGGKTVFLSNLQRSGHASVQWAPRGPFGPGPHAPVTGPLYRHRLHPQLLMKLSDSLLKELVFNSIWVRVAILSELDGSRRSDCWQQSAALCAAAGIETTRAGSRGKRMMYINWLQAELQITWMYLWKLWHTVFHP